MSDLNYSDGIAAARTMIALDADPSALQRRLPNGWELAPYAGDDLRGTSLRGTNMLVPFHEVYGIRSEDGRLVGLPQLSYVVFVSHAREQTTGEFAHLHWRTYTEDPAGVPGTYADGALADITRSQTFTKSDAERPASGRRSQPLPSVEKSISRSPTNRAATCSSGRAPTSRTCRSAPRPIRASCAGTRKTR